MIVRRWTSLRQLAAAALSAPPGAAAAAAATTVRSLASAVQPVAHPLARAGTCAEGLRAALRAPPSGQAAHSGSLGLRHYAELSAQQKLKAVVVAPLQAGRQAAQSLSEAPYAVYSRLPRSAQRWVDAVQQPGAVQRAITLQLEAAWQRHSRKIVGGSTVLLAWILFRAMRMSASAFVEVSQSMATTGLMALAASVAAFGALYMYRRRFVISPDALYRAAMVRLNTHPGVLEVMGAPVAGSEVRASVTSGGGLKFKGLRPKLRARRVQMLFPLRGSERRGLVSLEAKKKRGELQMKLLAVDVPMPAALGGEQRIFVEGGPKAYSRGGVLDELRRPFLAALTSEDQAEAEEEAEEAEEEKAAAFQAALAAPVAGEARVPRQGMYVHERVLFAVKGVWGSAKARWQRHQQQAREREQQTKQGEQAPPPPPAAPA